MNYLRSLLQFRRLVLLVILLSAWEFASRYILDKTQATLLPPPSGVFVGAMELSASGELWKHVRDSLRREFIAFCYASVAIPLGITMGCLNGLTNKWIPLLKSFARFRQLLGFH